MSTNEIGYSERSMSLRILPISRSSDFAIVKNDVEIRTTDLHKVYVLNSQIVA